jgi:hypothetical protein
VANGDEGPGGRNEGDPELGRVPRVLLGLLFLALGVALLYLLVTLWPAVTAAGAGDDGSVTWFWRKLSLTAETTLLLLVILVSALGSYIHATVSFSDFAGNRQLVPSWVWWYLLRVFVGSSLAVLFYFAIRGGFFSSATTSEQVNVYGIAALSGLVGLFSKQATDKLREIFDTAFRTDKGYGDDARGDSITNPAPTLDGSEPLQINHGELEIALVGTGFVKDSIVKVEQVGGKEVSRDVQLVGPARLEVTLEAEDVEVPGVLTFTVVNPEPGGGASKPLAVQVAQGNGQPPVTESPTPAAAPRRRGRTPKKT